MNNAVILATTDSDPETGSHALRIADDVIPYSTNPTTVIRQMRAEGLTWLDCGVYQHIADRQWNKDGECWQGNTAIGKDLSITAGTVSRAINKLKRAGYLSVRWSDTGRRMRVQLRGHARTAQEACAYALPYKEDKTKKTIQQEVCVFSKKHRDLIGDKSLFNLAVKYGERRVLDGLAVCDTYEQLDNPVGFLTKAIKLKWLPSSISSVSRFSENAHDHEKIILEFVSHQPGHQSSVDELQEAGKSEAAIAFKIWKGSI
jgi:DNA-binding MarR family transcriptional regulator